MTLEPGKLLRKIEVTDLSPVAWKRRPWDFEAAFRAAAYYARGWGDPAVVVPARNPGGRRVYEISRVETELTRFLPDGAGPVIVAVAYPGGEVKEARAT